MRSTIKVNPESFLEVSKKITQNSEEIYNVLGRLKEYTNTLQNDYWHGKGVQKFHQEMDEKCFEQIKFFLTLLTEINGDIGEVVKDFVANDNSMEIYL